MAYKQSNMLQNRSRLIIQVLFENEGETSYMTYWRVSGSRNWYNDKRFETNIFHWNISSSFEIPRGRRFSPLPNCRKHQIRPVGKGLRLHIFISMFTLYVCLNFWEMFLYYLCIAQLKYCTKSLKWEITVVLQTSSKTVKTTKICK